MTEDVVQGAPAGSTIAAHRTGWGTRIRGIHWVSALAVATQLLIGFFLLGGAAMMTTPWLAAHLSLGVAILGLTVVRLVCRFMDPAGHRTEPQIFETMAALAHVGLYALLILVPLTGWLGYHPPPFRTPPHLFGALPMPVLAGLSPIAPRTMLKIHGLASWALLILIGLHVAAALIHAFVLKDGILRGMVLGGRTKP